MQYFVKTLSYGLICTDDYEDYEVNNGLLFRNILADLKQCNIQDPYVEVYDRNLKFVCRLSTRVG